MANTTANEIITFFESSFAEKQVLPESLEIVWLRKAIAKYSVELDNLTFDNITLEFDSQLGEYVISTLAEFMKLYYQERQVSLVNKRVSIVGKDISIDGSNGSKTSNKAELEYIKSNTDEMINDVKPTAYA